VHEIHHDVIGFYQCKYDEGPVQQVHADNVEVEHELGLNNTQYNFYRGYDE
jgi:hypothetical protein